MSFLILSYPGDSILNSEIPSIFSDLPSDSESPVLIYAEMRFNFIGIFGEYFLGDLNLGVTIGIFEA